MKEFVQMQNAKCKMQIAEAGYRRPTAPDLFHFALCTLQFEIHAAALFILRRAAFHEIPAKGDRW